MMRHTWRAAFIALALAGCSGKFTKVGPERPVHYTPTGEAHGSACGVLLFNLIPINLNDRTERAYQQAIKTAGAEGLIDPTLVDRWYFIYVGGLYCTDVQGTGYRTVAAADQPS